MMTLVATFPLTALPVRIPFPVTSSTGAGVLPIAQAAITASAEEEREPGWLRSTLRDFRRIDALGPGWDSYGAARPSRSIMLSALNFLGQHLSADTAPPTVVPLPDGGVQLEWHRAGADVEVTFESGAPPELYFADVATGLEWEGLPGTGFSRFNLARRLRDAGR
jgi:hypothetical protein